MSAPPEGFIRSKKMVRSPTGTSSTKPTSDLVCGTSAINSAPLVNPSLKEADMNVNQPLHDQLRTRSLSLNDVRQNSGFMPPPPLPPKTKKRSTLFPRMPPKEKDTGTDTDNESGFTEVRSKSKRKRDSPSPTKIQKPKEKQQKILNWLSEPTKIRNSFENLPVHDTEIESEVAPIKAPKIPPIFVCGVEQMKPLLDMLKNIAGDDFSLKNVSRNQIKIQLKVNEHYSIVVNELKTRNTEFHSYQLKSDRTFKAVIVNLHQSTDKNELKTELEGLGHEVVYINNVMKRGTRTLLPLFVVELKTNTNNKSVYDIQYLMHSRIRIEPPRQKRQIVQCTNCQRYGHTKSYCNRQSRCVKCAQFHNTKNCTRTTKDENVKCALCEGSHPASYKGCSVYQEIRKRKFPTLRNKAALNVETTTVTAIQANQLPSTSTYISPGLTYAQVTRDPQPSIPSNNQENQEQPSHSRLENILENLMETMNNMNKMMTNMMTLITSIITTNSKCPKH